MPTSKPFIYLLILFAFSTSVFTQNFEDLNLKIKTAVENKDFKSAITELKTLQKDNSKIFTANNYDYLLARLSEKQGDFATATANYQAIINRNSVLKEYAIWHLSQIMRATGNLMMERIYLQELSIIADESLLNNAVKKRFARSNFESGNYKEAIRLLSNQSTPINRKKDDSQTIVETIKEQIPLFDEKIPREDLTLLAEAYLLNKQPEQAKEIFSQLVNKLPKANQPDDFALAGVKALDLLEVGKDSFGKTAPKLSDEEHFKRAEIYQFNRNFPLARIHYEAIVKNYPTSPKVPVSLYQIARGFGQERNYEKVIEWSDKLQKDFPENDLASASLYQSAGAFANLDKTSEAVSRYLKYIDENPDADNLERAYLNVIDAYRDEKNYKIALQWTAKTQEKFKGETGEAVALFSQIRIYISQENWQNALNDLDTLSQMKNLGGINIAGGTNKDEVTFLRGFVLEKLGRFQDAIDVYLSLDDGLKNYYGWRSAEHIKKIVDNKPKSAFLRPKTKILSQNFSVPNGKILEFGRKDIWQTPQKTKSHKTIADELLFLGLYDEATPELEISLCENLSKNTGSLSDFPNDTAFTLAVFYKRGNMANRAISYIEPFYKNLPNDFPIELIPKEQLELLYPKPYEESLVKYGKENNVDPRFLLSIMRQESRFQADVKSFAAARGLMQFISTTADEMAKDLKIENFQQDELYNPPTAIRFGSHYINKIFADFPNQPPAVAASYNGGEDRMMRWLKRANSDDPDRYVPEIVFSQTKDYVYKVMTNYRIYKMLYDENLKEIK